MEDLLFASFRLLGLLDAEYAGEVVCACVPVSFVLFVLDHQVHLCIVDECLFQMDAFMLEQSVV